MAKGVRVRACVLGQMFGRHSAISRGPEMYPGLLPIPLKAAFYTTGPLRDSARIRPSPAWYKGKPVLATVGEAGPAVSQLGLIQPGIRALGGQESLRAQEMDPCWPVERFILF